MVHFAPPPTPNAIKEYSTSILIGLNNSILTNSWNEIYLHLILLCTVEIQFLKNANKIACVLCIYSTNFRGMGVYYIVSDFYTMFSMKTGHKIMDSSYKRGMFFFLNMWTISNKRFPKSLLL